MRGVKPVTEQEVRQWHAWLGSADVTGYVDQHLDIAELLQRMWECNRDQAAYITQMKEAWGEVAKAAAKAKRQESLF